MAEYLTKTELKNRGWSDRLINEFYANPEKEGNSYGNTYYLYSINKIENIEQTEEFKIEYNKTQKRRKAMKKSVIKKKEKLVSEIEQKDIYISKLPLEKLRKLAISEYNDKNFLFDKHASKKSDRGFIERIMVNYVRHNLTEYEFILHDLKGKTGNQKAYLLLKKKVLQKIGKTYSSLSNEASRQIDLIPN